MRKTALAALLLATAACNQAPSAGNDATATAGAEGYDLAAQKAKLAVIEMKPDTSFLTDEERKVVNLLIQASEQMSLIYRAQRDADWKQTRAAIEKAGGGLPLEMYDRYYGPWDDLAENRPFFGEAKMPADAMPGPASGNSTCQKACQRVQPSICAASARSRGTWRKKPSINQMVKGMLSAT